MPVNAQAQLLPQTSKSQFIPFRDSKSCSKVKPRLLVGATSLQGGDVKTDQNRLLQTVVELLFKLPPVWELAKQKVSRSLILRTCLHGNVVMALFSKSWQKCGLTFWQKPYSFNADVTSLHGLSNCRRGAK